MHHPTQYVGEVPGFSLARGDGPPLRAKAGATAFRFARLCLRRDAERTEETPRPKGRRISGESEAGFRGEYL